MSFNLWERLKWFYLFIYLISWHSNLTFSFRGALYKDNRGPTPAKTALELAEIRSLFTAAAWHFSLVTRLHLSGIRRVWRALEGEGHFPFRGPALKDKTLLTALGNSENLAIICQTKDQSDRGSEGILLSWYHIRDVNWFAIMCCVRRSGLERGDKETSRRRANSPHIVIIKWNNLIQTFITNLFLLFFLFPLWPVPVLDLILV